MHGLNKGICGNHQLLISRHIEQRSIVTNAESHPLLTG
jgi:hypothetical protein